MTGESSSGNGQKIEEIYLAMGIENGPSGLFETPRRAFDDQEEVEKFLEYETYGGRLMGIELERTQDTETDQGVDGGESTNDADNPNPVCYGSKGKAHSPSEMYKTTDAGERSYRCSACRVVVRLPTKPTETNQGGDNGD